MNAADRTRIGTAIERQKMLQRLKNPALRMMIDGIATVGAFLLMVGALALWA